MLYTVRTWNGICTQLNRLIYFRFIKMQFSVEKLLLLVGGNVILHSWGSVVHRALIYTGQRSNLLLAHPWAVFVCEGR